VHTYSIPDLVPQIHEYSHERMKTDSFYVKIAASPCGNWLASGSNGPGSVFLFDVSNASRPSWAAPSYGSLGVELRGQKGEVGAVDWAQGSLATCADDGSVRIWRPNIDVYSSCVEDPLDKMWEWYWSRR
jgi:denticleless